MDMATSRTKTPRVGRKTKLGHDSVVERRLKDIRPSPENDRLYRPVDMNAPDIQALAQSIRDRGIMEPLVVTLDGYILSGHRRFAAARLAGLTNVPVRVMSVLRSGDPDGFVRLLREYNRQRDKTLDEKLREEIVSVDPEEAYQSLIEHRERKARFRLEAMELMGEKRRCRISDAKEPMLAAILQVIENSRQYWPLSDRRIHYSLLNDPPLRHYRKPNSRYQNDKASYKALVELLTRGRLIGRIPWQSIADSTRPVTTWDVHENPRTFVAREMDGLFKGYWRDLMQSQPNHIEIIGEKNTVDPILRTVAGQYTIPLTTGRGYCSLPPRYEMAQRFRKCGKEKLVLLMLSDFDPDGEEIAHSFARSMRDDFAIAEINPVKVALNAEQVRKYNLPPLMIAKETSIHHDKFVDKHGQHVWELEALEPSDLQDVLRDAIDAVIDIEAFNAELDAEKQDSAWLAGVRNTVHETLQGMDLTETEP